MFNRQIAQLVFAYVRVRFVGTDRPLGCCPTGGSDGSERKFEQGLVIGGFAVG
jgi:hypothetical protein